MLKINKVILTFLFIFLINFSVKAQNNEINLSGLWRFQLDPMDFGKTPGSELFLMKLSESINLPGSTDEGGKGIKTTARYVDRLTRKFEYEGAAWYQKEVQIPESWIGRNIILNLERCHWVTTVYVDGQFCGEKESLSTANRFDLTDKLTPGLHNITICVDNTLKYPMDKWAHGTTEHTQTNWNGIVGDIKLVSQPKVYIENVQVYTDVKKKKVSVKPCIKGLKSNETVDFDVNIKEKGGQIVAKKEFKLDSMTCADNFIFDLELGDDVKLWSEFSPYLYNLEATLTVDHEENIKNVAFGMRSVEQGEHHIKINGRNIHLRGVLDCAVFPKTGYPSTNVEDWKRIFETVRSYGMNHVRFHSWCPPKAAFEAGDELGMYLQAELPMWIKNVGQYPEREAFFEREMYAILDEYGNHPSFILMCNGNENEGDFAVLEDLIVKAQKHDSRRLYSASTARTHVKSDQFYVSHLTQKGMITVYEGQPATNWDRSKESDIDVPVIAHETGQRCMYPNFKEIEKYNGVLEARNFDVFRERLMENGMLSQADDFFKATGAHTILQYKEVNEALFRTANSGGFQLLGLADFPGQGTALVGVLDAFWESKGLVTPEKYRESCAPTVLLALFDKRAYKNDENIDAELKIYNYGENELKNNVLSWKLVGSDGEIINSGSEKIKYIARDTVCGLTNVSFALDAVKRAEKVTLKVGLGGVTRNEWDFWVYPSVNAEISKDFTVVTEWNDDVKALLDAGKKVLLVPREVMGRKAKFASHFWNPIMFRWDPMIVGTLIDNEHPAFNNFPTSYYADWQWWDILNHAKAIELTKYKDLKPVIQSVDSYEFNEKLGIAFEVNVSKGKLFVLSIDLQEDMTERLATQQLLESITKYINSDDFAPKSSLEMYELDEIFSLTKQEKAKKGNDSAVKQLLNR